MSDFSETLLQGYLQAFKSQGHGEDEARKLAQAELVKFKKSMEEIVPGEGNKSSTMEIVEVDDGFVLTDAMDMVKEKDEKSETGSPALKAHKLSTVHEAE